MDETGRSSGEADTISNLEMYKNRLTQVTNLNTSLYQTPVIFSTIIGGLWYFAGQHLTDHRPLMAIPFSFAAAVGWTGMRLVDRIHAVIVLRLADMAGLEKLGRADVPAEQHQHQPAGDNTRVIMRQLMQFAVGLSLLGAIWSVVSATSG